MVRLSHEDAIQLLEAACTPEVHPFSFTDPAGTHATVMQIGTRYTTVAANCVEHEGRSWTVTTFWGGDLA